MWESLIFLWTVQYTGICVTLAHQIQNTEQSKECCLKLSNSHWQLYASVIWLSNTGQGKSPKGNSDRANRLKILMLMKKTYSSNKDPSEKKRTLKKKLLRMNSSLNEILLVPFISQVKMKERTKGPHNTAHLSLTASGTGLATPSLTPLKSQSASGSICFWRQQVGEGRCQSVLWSALCFTLLALCLLLPN